VDALPAHVFIVEDDQLLASALSAQVETLGYRVAGTAHTAEEAVRGVLRSRPELVIMDLRLTGFGTGLDAARSIRENLEVPIIFYTAHGNDNALQQEVASMSHTQVLQKPAPEQTLLEAITGMLG
jgi:CheY-like chemotaxis protein